MAIAQLPVCLQCGTLARRPGVAVCGRCGLAFGERPRDDAVLPACPVCYREADGDGLLPAPGAPTRRVPLPRHIDEHDRVPVGDDDWLETLREGDRVRIGRWKAPFDLVRRYLVTGVVDAGRSRAAQHDAIVTAMAQLARWGRDVAVFGDQPEWAEARAAVGDLIERYHRGRA
jgi:hypothetical protein